MLRPRRPVGSAKSSQFFDRFPEFYETSLTGRTADRLNLRYEAIFAENKDIFTGARVVDIASHDGRWSLAALESGAAHVYGIEARADLVDNAGRTLGKYVDDKSRFSFVAGDVFRELNRYKEPVDVVLCLGFLYHTLRYNELFSLIRNLNPRHLILDTRVVKTGGKPLVSVRVEPTEKQANAVGDDWNPPDRALVAWPSVPAIRVMTKPYGFQFTSTSDWGSLLRDNPTFERVTDYAKLTRVTILLSATARDLPSQP